jgi:hypothetical protein
VIYALALGHIHYLINWASSGLSEAFSSEDNHQGGIRSSNALSALFCVWAEFS